MKKHSRVVALATIATLGGLGVSTPSYAWFFQTDAKVGTTDAGRDANRDSHNKIGNVGRDKIQRIGTVEAGRDVVRDSNNRFQAHNIAGDVNKSMIINGGIKNGHDFRYQGDNQPNVSGGNAFAGSAKTGSANSRFGKDLDVDDRGVLISQGRTGTAFGGSARGAGHSGIDQAFDASFRLGNKNDLSQNNSIWLGDLIQKGNVQAPSGSAESSEE